MKSRGLKRTDIPENIIPKFWSNVEVGRTDKCWPWKGTFRNKGKYGQIGFNHTYYGAHAVAFVLVKEDLLEGECSLHECDNPPCCNPAHLFKGTKAENNTDRNNKGRTADKKGEKNGRAKLTEEDVKCIREWCSHAPQKEVAVRYGVSSVLIGKIHRRELWRHVP